MVIAPEQAGKLTVIKGHFEDLESQKAEFEEFIAALAVPYQQCFHCHRHHFRSRYRYEGIIPYAETLRKL